MIEEALVIGSIALTGTLFMRILGLKGWGLMPLGFLAGCSLFTVYICLHILFDLPLSYWYSVGLLPTTTLALYTLWLRRNKPQAPSRQSLLLYGGALAACLVLLFALWDINISVFATDTLRQSLVSSLIAGGNTEFMSSNLSIKRLNSISMLDALSYLYEPPRVRTLPTFISLAAAGSIAWSLMVLLKDRIRDRKQVITIGLAGALVFISIYSVWWQSFYQGTHILYGGLLLAAVVSGWLLARGDHASIATKNSLIALIALSIAGLILSRPEAGILVPVALAPLLVHPYISTTAKHILISSLGVSILLQQGIIYMISLKAGYSVPSSTALIAAAGTLLLSLNFIIRLKVVSRYWQHLLWAAEILGWVALLAFTAYDPSIMWKSLIGTIRNVVFGYGLWGISYAILVILFGLTLLFEKRHKLDIILRYPITTMLPFGFLIGYLREGAYRAGTYDTFNRMLMHILPILIVYIIYRYYYQIKPRQQSKSRKLKAR